MFSLVTWILLFIVFVIKCKYVILISEMAEFAISDQFPQETEGESNLPLEECNITKTERTQDPDNVDFGFFKFCDRDIARL